MHQKVRAGGCLCAFAASLRPACEHTWGPAPVPEFGEGGRVGGRAFQPPRQRRAASQQRPIVRRAPRVRKPSPHRESQRARRCKGRLTLLPLRHPCSHARPFRPTLATASCLNARARAQQTPSPLISASDRERPEPAAPTRCARRVVLLFRRHLPTPFHDAACCLKGHTALKQASDWAAPPQPRTFALRGSLPRLRRCLTWPVLVTPSALAFLATLNWAGCTSTPFCMGVEGGDGGASSPLPPPFSWLLELSCRPPPPIGTRSRQRSTPHTRTAPTADTPGGAPERAPPQRGPAQRSHARADEAAPRPSRDRRGSRTAGAQPACAPHSSGEKGRQWQGIERFLC